MVSSSSPDAFPWSPAENRQISLPAVVGQAYAAPLIKGLGSGDALGDDGAALLSTAGGTQLTITGINFGRADPPKEWYRTPVTELPAVKVSCGDTTEGKCFISGDGRCEVVSRTHTEIKCLTPPGEGVGLRVTVTVSGQTACSGVGCAATYGLDNYTTKSDYQLAFRSPTVTGVSTDSPGGAGANPTSGKGVTVTVTGTDFGVSQESRQVFILDASGAAVSYIGASDPLAGPSAQKVSHSNKLKLHSPDFPTQRCKHIFVKRSSQNQDFARK